MAASANRANSGDPPGDEDLEEIDIAEEELIDAYVRNELPAEERRLLEKGLRSSPQLVERLHFARLLAGVADRGAEDEVSAYQQEVPLPRPKSWWPFGLTWGPRPALNLAFAAWALIIFIGGAGLLTGWLRLRRDSQQLAEQQAALERQKLELQKSSAEQRLATDQLRAQLKEEQQKREADQQRIAELIEAQNQRSTAQTSTIANLFLFPTSRGSEPEKELKLPAGTSKIRLQLAVDSIDYRGFVAEIKNSQDKEVFRSKVGPPRSGKLVTITIPSKLLPPNAYSLQLSGIAPDGTTELVGNYSFRIAEANK